MFFHLGKQIFRGKRIFYVKFRGKRFSANKKGNPARVTRFGTFWPLAQLFSLKITEVAPSFGVTFQAR
jgi:hypothetical protein